MEDAPQGFWTNSQAPEALVDGVYLTSAAPTRFFQTIDAYPSEWGRLSWRVQLNNIVAGRPSSPVFRTLYSGVEWNLNRPDSVWFLSAWFRWAGPGPPRRESAPPQPARIEGDTALFPLGWPPNQSAPIFLRSRVDARDRRSIAESLRSQHGAPPEPDSKLLVLDDFL